MKNGKKDKRSTRDDIISVIGAGSWGTTIARVIAENNAALAVRLWAYEKSVVKSVNTAKENSLYLPGIVLPPNITATGSLREAVTGSRVLILATPSKVIYDTCLKIHKHVAAGSHIGYLSKGFCKVGDEILTISDAIALAIPSIDRRIAAISGPSHAEEVCRGYHTCLNIGSREKKTRELFVRLLACKHLECRDTDDIKGVELGGTLKNPAAIAAGMISILPGCGDNLTGALIAEALKEMLRLGKCFGAREETIIDISGLGDLVATAMSEHSRNRRFGKDIAKQIMSTGKSVNIFDRIILRIRPEYVLGKMSERLNYLAEGAYAIEPIIEFAEKSRMSFPIYQSLYEVLLNKKDPGLLVETVKNPEKFAEIYERTSIQVSKRKQGMERATGSIFKKIILKKSLDFFLHDVEFRARHPEFREEVLKEIAAERVSGSGTIDQKLVNQEHRLYNQLTADNFERKISDICMLYVNDISDSFNYYFSKGLVKIIKILNLLNVWFKKDYSKNFFEHNIKITGDVKNLKKITDFSNVVYVATFRSYLDFIYINMAIDRFWLHVPRFFVSKEAVSGRLQRLIIKLTGGFIVDAGKFSNPIYRQVVHNYLAVMIEHGVSVLYFPELRASDDGSLGSIREDFLTMIRECLFKNTEEIALVPVELSYYARAGGNRADQKKILTLENVMTQVVRINFSEPVLASDYSNASEPVSLLGDAIVSRWKSDAFVYPHYLFCRILREAHYSVPVDDLSERINDFLQKRHLWDRYEIRDILREGMEFTLKNELGLIEGGNLTVTKKDEVNYYANLI